MRKPWIKHLSTEPVRSIIYLSALILSKLIFQIQLFSRGFINLAADEFSRGIRAAEWASQPNFNLLTDLRKTWLPFEKYLNGMMLLLWHDVILAPRVTVFIASCLVLVALFLLVYHLFDDFRVAALAAMFITFQPWTTWLSGTPMLEMYYFAPFFGGLIFLITWLKKGYQSHWFWAGCCFLLASGFHIQSWTYINFVNLFTVYYAIQVLRQRQFGQLWRLIGFYFLGNTLVLTIAATEYLSTGRVFAFFSRHTTYSRWYYHGYKVPISEKLLYYPQLIVQNTSTVTWILLIVGLVFLLRDRASKWTFSPLALAIAALSLNSVLNATSGPPSAAPGRYSLFYLMLLSPYLGYSAYRLSQVGQQAISRRRSLAAVVLALGLFLYGVVWSIARIPAFPPSMPREAIDTGYALDQVLSQEHLDDGARYMVELKYWDFLALRLTARHYDTVVYDRVYNMSDRDVPSVFSGETTEICETIGSQNIQAVALYDPKLKANADQAGCLRAHQEIGGWAIYTRKP